MIHDHQTPSIAVLYLKMLRLRTPDASVLRKALAVVADLVDVANIAIADDGVTLQAMDSSHVCLVSLRILPEYFDLIDVGHPATIGIKLSSFIRMLTCVEGPTTFTIDDDDAFRVACDSAFFALRTLDIEQETMAVPDISSDVVIDIDSIVFQRLVKDLGAFGDVATIRTAPGSAMISTTGDIGDATCVLPGERTAHIATSMTSSYAIRYLASFAKAASVAPTVNIGMMPDMPLVLTYAFPHGSLSFYLAPKIDDDDIDDAL